MNNQEEPALEPDIAPTPGFSPRPILITLPAGQEAKIVMGTEFSVRYVDDSTLTGDPIEGPGPDTSSPSRRPED